MHPISCRHWLETLTDIPTSEVLEEIPALVAAREGEGEAVEEEVVMMTRIKDVEVEDAD